MPHSSVIRTVIFVCLALSVAHSARAVDGSAAIVGDPDSAEQGFQPLLGENAQTLWRGYAKEGWPKNWSLDDGVLARAGDGGDITTVEEFGDFDLRLEWKISPAGNSGILYHVSLGDAQPYITGIECQVLDDSKHRDGKNELTSAGSLYAMYARRESATAPVGEWNKARIVVNGNHIQHWLNGKVMVDCQRDSEEWTDRLAKSKFSTWEKFAKNRSGHIALQDHHDPVWYCNIRIKRLSTEE